MNCEARRELLFMYCLGVLDKDEQREVRAHLATGCVACAARVTEANETLAHLAFLLPAARPRSQVWQRLQARIERAPAVGLRGAPPPADQLISELDGKRPSSVRSTALWSAVAGVLATTVLVGVSLGPMIVQQRNQLLRDRRQGAAREARIRQLAGQVQVASRVLSLLHSPQPHITPLRSGDTGRASGLILWDRHRRQCHCYAFDLAPLEPARAYRLWLEIPGGEFVSAGHLNVDKDGNGRLIADIPAGVDNIASARVTDEPTPGADQPSGQVHLGCEF